MLLDLVHGLIDRRILVNFRIDPGVLARVLPPPFRPQIVAGFGLAGICLLRLRALRPRPLPKWTGLVSENAAHRVAVTWSEAGHDQVGVYVPRRDTSSPLLRAASAIVFPWEHHRASFEVREHDESFHLAMQSDDGRVHVRFDGRVAARVPSASVFGSLGEAEAFFGAGSRGYSPAPDGRLHAVQLQLDTPGFPLEPLAIESVASSFFADEGRFPAGSVELDSAFLMRGIEHHWKTAGALSA